MPDSLSTPKPKSNVVSDESNDLDIVVETPKADESKAETDELVDSVQDDNTPERNTSVISDESTDLEIFIAALEANKLKAITDKPVDSVQDNPTPEHDISVVSDKVVGDKEANLAIGTTTPKVDESKVTTDAPVDSVQKNHTLKHDTSVVIGKIVSDKEADLAIGTITPKGDKSKVTTDAPADSVQDNHTPEHDTSVVNDKIISDKEVDLAIDTVTPKASESVKTKAITEEFADFIPQADAPAPVHVTTGSSLTPKGRLIKTSKTVANGSRAFIWYLLALVVLVVDQWTKWLAETNLTFNKPVSVIEPFLNWTLAYNYGAAFSFLADAGGWQKWFFSGLALVMALFLTIYLAKAPRQAKLLAVGLALVLGGAVGNLIDRLLHGHVIDFIHVHYADVWNYPIFNIADMGICIGVAIIIIDMIFLENKRNS